MPKNKTLEIFKANPFKDVVTAVLNGNTSEIFRRLRNPRSGWAALKVKRFPTSASEANYPQKVKRNGA